MTILFGPETAGSFLPKFLDLFSNVAGRATGFASSRCSMARLKLPAFSSSLARLIVICSSEKRSGFAPRASDRASAGRNSQTLRADHV